MNHPCDLCGATAGTEIEPGIVVCNKCSFVYVPERRTPQEIAADWTNVYRSGAYDPNWPGVKARLFYVVEWLDQKIGLEGKSVLDIGAGYGFFLKLLRERGAQPVGLEPDNHNANMIRIQDIPCFTGSIETVPNPGQYDLVTILWTLENCGDCLAMLRYAKDALAPGGRVVVATGSRILVPFKKPYSAYFGKLSPDLHCFRWTPQTLIRAFGLVGLQRFMEEPGIDQDVLISVAHIPPPRNYAHHPGNDPQAVISFFRSWREQFP